MSEDDDSKAVFVHSFTLVATVAAAALYGYVLARVPKAMPGMSETYRQRCHTYVSTSVMGSVLEAVMAMFSIGSCVTFVWETYIDGPTPTWMFCAEMMFSVFFTFQYVLGLYVAPSRCRFVFSLHPIVDKVTVIPVLILYFSGTFTLTGGNVSFLRFSRVMKFARVLRLLRILRSVTVVSSAVTHDAVQNQFITFVSMLLSLLVITTGFVQFISNDVENDEGEWGIGVHNMQFHDALYFSIITFGLVGYGDIHPTQTIGRLSMTLLITVAFISIPMQMGVLVRKFRMRPGYSGVMNVASKESHIIVACDVACTGIPDFLAEFFHEDHGFQNAKICLLVPGEPNMYMQALILRYRRVTYLRGDAMSAEDLTRARCERADAAFLLADRFASDADEQDSVTVLRAITMKSRMSPRSIYVQILLPENRRHLRMSGVPDANVLCVAQTKSSLVGLSLQMPGIAPLIQNLVSSISAKASSGIRNKDLADWQREYLSGLTQEIYSVPLPRHFRGRTFTDLSLELYRRYSLLLFGLERICAGRLHVVLSPGRPEAIQRGDVGFFIAEDQLQMEQMLTDAVAAGHREEKTHSNFGRRTVPQWAKRLFSSRGGKPQDKYSRRVVRTDSAASVQKARRFSLPMAMLDTSSRRTTPDDVTAGGPPQPQEHRVLAPPSSRVEADSKTMPSSSMEEQGVTGSVMGVTGSVMDTVPGGMAGVRPSVDVGSPRTVPRQLRRLQSRDTLASKYDGTSLERHPSHPFMFFNTYALNRQPVSAMPDLEKWATRHMGGVFSSSLAERGTPHRYDAASAFKAVMDGQEVVGIRVGNSNGVAWERCAATLFRGVGLDGRQRRSRRVNLLCALQMFYDSSGFSKQGDCSVLLREVQQVLNHLTTITVPKVVSVGPRVAPRRHARLGSNVFLQDNSLMERYALRVLDGTRGLVHGHIIVCAHSGTGLAFVIEALRNYDSARTQLCLSGSNDDDGDDVYPVRPIVGLVSDDLSMYEREILASYSDLFIVKGSPTSLPDLVRAGLETASVMACHANPSHGTKFSGAGDAQVVMTTLIVESIYPGLRVVAELNRPKFVKHLGVTGDREKSSLPEWLYVMELVYAAGDVVNSSFLEALLCQAFFNSSIISVVEALLDHTEVGGVTVGIEGMMTPAIGGRASKQARKASKWADKQRHTSYMAAGRARRQRLMLGKRMYDDEPHEEYKGGRQKGSTQSTKDGMKRGHLFQVDMPVACEGRSYAELFEHLVQQFDVIPMGLLRNTNTGSTRMDYVLTNPGPETVCCDDDKVFVLGVPRLGAFGEDGRRHRLSLSQPTTTPTSSPHNHLPL